ncbi:MAG: type II secretion system protein J [Fervidobacterium sp.]
MILRKGFALTESIVAIFLISLIFMIITSGLSVVFNTVSSVQNMQRITELENFVARWVALQSDFSNLKNEINQVFYKTTSPQDYPIVKSVSIQNVGNYFDKLTFQIEYLPNKFKIFVVYKYRGY